MLCHRLRNEGYSRQSVAFVRVRWGSCTDGTVRSPPWFLLVFGCRDFGSMGHLDKCRDFCGSQLFDGFDFAHLVSLEVRKGECTSSRVLLWRASKWRNKI